MRHILMNLFVVLVLLANIAGFALTPASTVLAADNSGRSVDLPSPLCDRVQVPQGNRVAFHAYAIGVQSYRWNGTAWVFVEPIATLYADANYHGKVGIHYAGPTWEHNGGSKVSATRLEGCTPDPTAIPWLLLQAVSNDGQGIFANVTFIQRVNTLGGVAPAAPGASVGAISNVPYTAEYYFYRAQD